MTIDELINLEESIINYKKENREDLYVKVLVRTMLQRYFVAMNVGEKQDRTTIIIDRESKSWMPIYTSVQYIKGGRKKNNIVTCNLPEIIEMIIDQKHDGIIINPFKETEIYINKKDLYVVLLSYTNNKLEH